LNIFHHPHLTSRNSVFDTPGEKPGGSRVARVVGAALEPHCFSPGISEYRRLNVGEEMYLTDSSIQFLLYTNERFSAYQMVRVTLRTCSHESVRTRVQSHRG
jgi:hypothetical protein